MCESFGPSTVHCFETKLCLFSDKLVLFSSDFRVVI
jgi:hypothetical protein